VKELRESKGWSQQALAQRAGVHYRTIQDIEAGVMPRTSTAIAIAKALDVTLDQLLGDRQEKASA
jgi:transcriptional regulator with XRE-family HTH domain